MERRVSYTGQGGAGVDKYLWDGTSQLWGPVGACDTPYTQVYYVDGGTAVPLADQNGSACLPFASISQALTAIGVPADAADQGKLFMILCTPLVYDEDLTIPARRRIAIGSWSPDARAQLGTTAVPRGISWTQAFAAISAPPRLALEIDVSGGITLSDGGFAFVVELILRGDVGDTVDASAHDRGGSNVKVFSGTPIGILNVGPTGGVSVVGSATELIGVYHTNFLGTIDVRAVNRAEACVFNVKVEVDLADALAASEPRGFYACVFVPDFEFAGPADALRCDGATQFSVEQADVLLTGGATVDRIDDPMLRTDNADLSGGAYTSETPDRIIFVTVLAPGGPNEVFLPNGAPGKTSPKVGDFIQVKDAAGGGSADNITIDGNGNTIDGAASVLIAADYGSLSFRFNGTEWSII
jgi:hypothetical protein